MASAAIFPGSPPVNPKQNASPPKATPTPVSSGTGPGTGKTTPKTTPTPAPYPGYMTPAQEQAQIAQLVAASQLQQKQSIAAQQASDAAMAANQVKTTQGYSQALAELYANIAPGVQQGYTIAGDNDSAFGKGFSDGLAHVQSQMGQQDNSVLGVSGGTPGQAANLAAAGGGTGLTDALYNTAYQGATGLQTQGAAADAAAKQLTFTAGQQGLEAIGKINNQETANQGAFNQQLTNLAAQIPGLQLSYRNQIDAQQSADQRNADAEANYKSEETARTAATKLASWKANFSSALDEAKVTGFFKGMPTAAEAKFMADATGVLPNGQPTLAARKAQAQVDHWNAQQNAANAKVNPTLSAGNHFLTGADGQPILGTDGKPVPYTPPTKSGGALTASQALKQVEIWTKGTQKNVRTPVLNTDGTPKTNPTSGAPIVTSTTQTEGQLDYQGQISALTGVGRMTPAAATRAVDSVVKPGSLGRPWYTARVKAVLSRSAGNGPLAAGANVRSLNGHAMLDPIQYKALKAAGLLPAGTLAQENGVTVYLVGIDANGNPL